MSEDRLSSSSRYDDGDYGDDDEDGGDDDDGGGDDDDEL